MSSSSSFPSEAAPDTPGGDPMEAYATQHALEKDAAKEAHLSGVNVNVDDAAVLKEAEAATPGPLVGAEGGTSLAKRVHEAATKGMPGEEATMKVTPQEAERIQVAESRVVAEKDRAAESGEEAATPHARVFP